MQNSVAHERPSTRSRSVRPVIAVGVVALMGFAGLLSTTQSASATATALDLGTAGSYSVLGGASVTNTGSSVLALDVGVSPGTAISGFPPGLSNGTTHAGDAHALQAQSDLVIAYDAAAGQAPDANIDGDIGGRTLVPGVYKGASSIGLTGPLTLDAEGDPNAVFVFQIGSALTTATSSSVELINGAQGCNIFWQIGSSATLGTQTAFVGNILALTSISANTGATVDGRLLARNGSVTLDSNTVFGGPCVAPPTGTPTSTGTATVSPSGTATTSPTDTPTTTTPTSTATTVAPSGTADPSGTAVPTVTATPTGTSTAATPTATTPTSTTAAPPPYTVTAPPGGWVPPPNTPWTPPRIPGLPSTGGEGPAGEALLAPWLHGGPVRA